MWQNPEVFKPPTTGKWYLTPKEGLGLSKWLSGKESACSAIDVSLIPGLRRSSGKEMETHFSILAWEIPWTEEFGRLQSVEFQKSWRQLSNSTTTTLA